MGGSGSGRHWGCGRATVEDGLSLDINKLVRDGNIRPSNPCGRCAMLRIAKVGNEK
jgi:hypothetical protein